MNLTAEGALATEYSFRDDMNGRLVKRRKWRRENTEKQDCYSFKVEQDDLTIYFIRGIIFSSKEKEERIGKKQREKVDINDDLRKDQER